MVLSVTVPSMHVPGEKVQVEANGQIYDVDVPRGLRAGQRFDVEIPAPPPPAATSSTQYRRTPAAAGRPTTTTAAVGTRQPTAASG